VTTSRTAESLRHPAGMRELKQDFLRVDRDDDGRVDYEEFKQLMRSLDAGMSDRELSIGFHEIDTDRDGVIDLKEFMDWWRSD
jgi:Ca2+-binding EF-hand superfamily protein